MFQGFRIVSAPVDALTPVTMYMWSPTRLPPDHQGVDISTSSPALKLEARFVRIEPSELAEAPGLSVVGFSDWSVMRVSAEPSPAVIPA